MTQPRLHGFRVHPSFDHRSDNPASEGMCAQVFETSRRDRWQELSGAEAGVIERFAHGRGEDKCVRIVLDRSRNRPLAPRPGQPRLRPDCVTEANPAGIILCAMTHWANEIAYAVVRDQTPWQGDRWTA